MTEKICQKCGNEFNNYDITPQICNDETIYEYRCPFCGHVIKNKIVSNK